MQELDASFHYEDSSFCNQDEMNELTETFNDGINNLRACFEENMKRMTTVFHQKMENHQRFKEKLEKNRINSIEHFKKVHKRLNDYRDDIVRKGSLIQEDTYQQ